MSSSSISSELAVLLRDPASPAPIGRSYAALWKDADAGEQIRFVLSIARQLKDVNSLAAQRLSDPRWRDAIGVPLWLASFALARRLQRRSRARNTILARRYDWLKWRRWCKANELPSFNPSAAQLDRFLGDVAPAHKRSSLRRMRGTLVAMHEAAGLPSPFAVTHAKEVWRAATRPTRPDDGRKQGDRRSLRERPAAPLNYDLLLRVLTSCEEDGNLLALRDAALLAVGYDLAARRSEPCELLIEDLDRQPDGSMNVLIRSSKTDQDAEGAVMFLRPTTARRVDRWIAAAGLESGPLFRSLRGLTGNAPAAGLEEKPSLKPLDFMRILRRRVAVVLDVGDVQRFSGHSLRIGAAQDLAAAGIPDSAIAQAGRWRSTQQVIHYTKGIAAKFGGMARLAKLQSNHDHEAAGEEQ